ncbi:acyl-CoA Delta(11) desaturase [Drosophila subobscura]|uniref:acyl-CoA Delta(11) desaturase n=1 Tax=Drosophila subobscura TaxID=7241 RepID=UPI00155A80AB|nr:acyl-CoA Delta(11) desaturase [Drosophila subobscura]
MPPNSRATGTTGVLYEGDTAPPTSVIQALKKGGPDPNHKLELAWLNITLFTILHVSSVYGLWLLFTAAKWQTFLLFPAALVLTIVGISGGAHRLWAHRTFKANTPLRLIFMFLNTLAFQDAVYYWARDHRLHHKYSETDADPYNSQRGWFFSHIGWLCCKKHPDVTLKGREIDLSDLRNDKLVMFQKKHYLILMPLICFVLPTVVPMYYWGESLNCAWHCFTLLRWCASLNIVWLVNSSAHMYGKRPYDKNIAPTNEAFLMWFRVGEGYHNYHHVFPWDYKSAELGKYSRDATTYFIDFFARIGWAYDLKSVSTEVLRQRITRTGDGTHPVWGWGDKDQPQEDVDSTTITHRRKETAADS